MSADCLHFQTLLFVNQVAMDLKIESSLNAVHLWCGFICTGFQISPPGGPVPENCVIFKHSAPRVCIDALRCARVLTEMEI